MDFVKCIESNLSRKAQIQYLEMQPGDVEVTQSDISELYDWVGYRPIVSVEEGVKIFGMYTLYYR